MVLAGSSNALRCPRRAIPFNMSLADFVFQLIDELAILMAAPPSATSSSYSAPKSSKEQSLTLRKDNLTFSSTLLNSDNDRFEAHLFERSSQIKSAITRLFSNAPLATPGVLELQQRIASLLAAEKAHATELQRLTQEKDAMSDRYESAVSRYMIAEKKLDRVKSAQVAKLEAAAMTTSRPAASSSTPTKTDGEVAEIAVSGDVEKARKEATALAEKRQQQLEILVKQNVKLENELAATKAKWEGLTDDDYAKSELFQTIKSQLDDTVKRVNDLEAQNIQLREEARVLQGERISYKEAADTEVREQTMEMQNQLAQGDMDLVRVRHSRDEIKTELSIRVATIEQHRTSQAHMQELLEAKDLRIQALESEADRLRQSAAQVDGFQTQETDIEAVLARLRVVENEKTALESEVRSMEAAYKKAQTLASRKLTEISDWEDKLQRLSGEKAKADQKYFASMKSIEAKNAELKALKAQAARSTDMVSTLKEAESASRLQLDTLNKQLAEAKESFGTVSNQHRAIQHTITEQKALINRLEAHSNEFKKQVAVKVDLTQAAEKGQRSAEGELAELKVRLESTEKSLASWKKKGTSSTSEEYETLRVSIYFILILLTMC